MTRKTHEFICSGGLDEATQPLVIAPGRVINAMNHEAIDAGYGRIDGFERLDGRTSPTDFPFYRIAFDTGVGAILAGQTITGLTSGATGVVLTDVDLDSGAWDGTGIGSIGFRSLTGNFVLGEALRVGGVTKVTSTGTEQFGVAGTADAQEEEWAEAARDYARSLIQTVPGSGPVRGVCVFDGDVYAVRDNAGATAGVMHKATPTGWQALVLLWFLAFNSGSDEIAVGDVIQAGGGDGTVEKVVVTDGDWTTGDAEGHVILSSVTGTFTATTFIDRITPTTVSNIATVAADSSVNALPPGGRYEFLVHNFFGNAGAAALYGVNGVGTAFSFDGTFFAPIATGMTDDKPFRISEFRNHLFLAFAGGSAQHSSAGQPYVWDAQVGTAAEIGIGSEITDFISNVDSLIILGEGGVKALTGTGVSDWLLSPITNEAGAKPWTGQQFGPGLFMDNRGLRSVSTTQAYGKFAMGSLSSQARRTLEAKTRQGISAAASCVVRTKNHYRLFFSDGSGMSFYLGRKAPEAMPFNLGKIVRCIFSGEDQDLGEVIVFGSDDGYVYQLDKGTSFDGDAIEAFMQLAYTHMGTPNLLKRLHKIGLDFAAPAHALIGVTMDFDYAAGEQAGAESADMEVHGSGALWNVGQWGQFVWGAPIESTLAVDADGQGCAASVIIYSNGAANAAYQMRGARLFYSERGGKR